VYDHGAIVPNLVPRTFHFFFNLKKGKSPENEVELFLPSSFRHVLKYLLLLRHQLTSSAFQKHLVAFENDGVTDGATCKPSRKDRLN